MPPKKRGGQSVPGSASAKAESYIFYHPAVCRIEGDMLCLIHIGKNNALFCRGSCKQWLHRYCASVTVPCYKSIKDEGLPFFCFWCCQVRSQREIALLMSTVEQLKLENAKLNESLGAAQSQVCASQADG